MGEYAEMEIFAQQLGKTSSSLTLSELADFYHEFDNPPPKKPNPFKCPICNKQLRSKLSQTQHLRDKHKK